MGLEAQRPTERLCRAPRLLAWPTDRPSCRWPDMRRVSALLIISPRRQDAFPIADFPFFRSTVAGADAPSPTGFRRD